MSQLIVEVYGKKGCILCKEARKVVGKVNDDTPFHFKDVDIASSDDLFRRYDGDVPTVFINGKKVFKFKVDEDEFRKRVRREIIKVGLFNNAQKKGHKFT